MLRSSSFTTIVNPDYITLEAKIVLEGVSNPTLQDDEHKGIENRWFTDIERFNDFTGVLDAQNNHLVNHITELGIEVEYFGNIDVALDWFRIETPAFRDLIRGQRDQEIFDEYQESLDLTLNTEINTGMNDPRSDLRIFRFFLLDEPWPSNYASQRYLNMLLDTNGIIEFDTQYDINQMKHSTQVKELWTGWTHAGAAMVTQPYVKRTDYWNSSESSNSYYTSMERMNIQSGYWGKFDSWTTSNNVNTFDHDSLSSHYETYIDRWHRTNGSYISNVWDLAQNEDIHTTVWADVENNSSDYFYAARSTQMCIERNLYNRYHDSKELFFIETPWISNLWFDADITYVPTVGNGEIRYGSSTPKIGEMMRYEMNNAIILGAKGLLTWFGSSSGNVHDTPISTNTLKNTQVDFSLGMSRFGGKQSQESYYIDLENDFNNQEIVTSNTLGGDYLDMENDAYELGHTWVSNNLSASSFTNLSNLVSTTFYGDNLELNGSIYLGSKSWRTESMKFNRWLDMVEDTLLNLRLQAWHSKGYQEWDDWDDKNLFNADQTPLLSYIDLENIRTKRFYQPDWQDTIHNYNPDWEDHDSSFYDITLLHSINAESYKNNGKFYIGVVNRRTDPLLYLDIDDGSDTFGWMNFLSASEFDDYVQNGGPDRWGTNQSSTFWKEHWWKQLGTRIIEIPFDYPDNDQVLEIKEIGYDQINSSTYWYYDDDFYDLVSSTISTNNDWLQNSNTIQLMLRPGEGKILEISPVSNSFLSSCLGSPCADWNEWGNFKIRIDEIPSSSTLTGNNSNCCFDIVLENNLADPSSTCNLPFIIKNEDFTQTTYLKNTTEVNGSTTYWKTLSNNSLEYAYFESSAPASESEVSLGTICLPRQLIEPSEPFTFQVFLANSSNFQSCNNVDVFELSCTNSETFSSDCCSNTITEVDKYTQNIKDPNNNVIDQSCCVELEIDPMDASACVWSVQLEIGDRKTDLINKGSSKLDFSNYDPLTICSDNSMVDCLNSSTYAQSARLIFYDEYGRELTCSQEVELCGYCHGETYFYDDNYTSSPKQTSNEVVKTLPSNDLTVKLYPNPAENIVNLEFISNTPSVGLIQIANSLGETFFFSNEIIKEGKNKYKLNVNEYPPGMYYVNIQYEEQSMTIPFVVK